ncbi:O-antigen ligase family protein [Pectinatus brassicae]|uniref:O-antigen ligase n=1 Tax=Pectinatus brassicae TaxID=862415 RepID=A0A840UNY7_9FIRM|nr:O-antigen ligase family protein [Pectinatus brassicae]MBB5335922.1 O-antigen ligase [Pectinatus brassicae]
MIFKPYHSFLEKIIIFCMLIFSLTFFIEGKVADTFIRTAFLLILIFNLKQSSKYFNWEYYKPYLSPLIIFFLIVFFISFFSTNFSRSILTYEAWIKMMIPFLSLIFFDVRKNTLYLLFFSLLFSFICNDVYSIYIYFTHGLNRVGGFDNNIMSFANLLLIQIPVFFIFCLRKHLKFYQRILILIITSIVLISLFTNNTRAIWIIFIIDCFFLFFVLIKKWYIKFIFILIFITLLTSLYSFNGKINNRVNNIFNTNNVSTRGHYFYMRDGYRLFLHNFYFGVGLDNFPNAILKQNLISDESKENLKHDLSANINNTLVIPHAHNELVMFLAQFGIIGALLYILYYGNIIFFTIKNWKKKKDPLDLGFFLITINYLLHGLVDYNFSNLNTIAAYFFIWGLYIKYNYQTTNVTTIKIFKKTYLLYFYIFIVFIILLRIISRYLIKYH